MASSDMGSATAANTRAAALEDAIRELHRPFELDELMRVMREFMPARDLEAIQKPVETWIARGRPRNGVDNCSFYMLDWEVRGLDRLTRSRIAHRTKFVKDSAWRQQDDAFVFEHRLFPRPYIILNVFGPDYSSERDEANPPQSLVDQTSSPAWLVAQLESTAAGCRQLLKHWTLVRGFLEPRAKWFTETSFNVIALLGKRPRDILESPEVVEVFLASHALDRRGWNPFMALRGEVSLDEVNDLLRRLGPRVKSTPDPGDAQQAHQTLLAIVDRAIAALTAKAVEHEQPDKSDEVRRAAEQAFDTSPRGRDLERHDRARKKSIKSTVRMLRMNLDRRLS